MGTFSIWAGSVFLIALLAYFVGRLSARTHALKREQKAYETYRKIHQANCTRTRAELLECLRGGKGKQD